MPTAGSGLGVFAELTNQSKYAIEVREQAMALAMAPELDPTHPDAGWWAIFPAEDHNGPKQEYVYASHVLAPGDSYKALFVRDIARPDSGWDKASFLTLLWRQTTTELRYVFFSPGDYRLVVTGSYTVLSKPPVIRSFSQSSIIRVSAPQTVVMLGATLGGLFAFLLLPKKNLGNYRWPFRVGMLLVGAFGACLLSVITTILASRIADTQFFIRVTVNDLWGAVAVGFVANLAGARLLNRFLPSAESVVPSTEAAAVPATPTGMPAGPSSTP